MNWTVKSTVLHGQDLIKGTKLSKVERNKNTGENVSNLA